MKNSKLIKVLRTFSKSEMKQFGKMVSSPFFSSGRNLIPLYKAFRKYYPEFNSASFSKENILKELEVSGYKTSSALLKTQMSEMYKLAEKFLTLQQAKNQIGLDAFYFAGTCLKRGLYDIGEAKIKNTISKLKKYSISHWFYHNYFYAGAIAKTMHEIKGAYSKAIPYYKHDSDILLHQFLFNAAHYISSIAELKMEFNFDTGDNLLYNFMKNIDFEKLLINLNVKSDNYSIASRTYIFLILTLLKFPDEGIDDYYELKKELFKNINLLDAFEKGFFLHVIYWLVNNMATGKRYTEFTKEIFEIIEFRIKNNLYKRSPNDYFTVSEFCSFFYTGFNLKNKRWMLKFKSKYLDELPPQEIKNCDEWTDILIDFLEHDFIKCLKGISRFKNSNFIFVFTIKRVQLMVFYELGYIAEAFYAIDAFKSFLKKNNNIAEQFLSSSNEFIKFYSVLLKIKEEEIEVDLKGIIEEINCSKTENQGWLMEKFEQMLTDHNKGSKK